MEIPDRHFRYILIFYIWKGKNAEQARKKLYDVYGGIVYYVPRRTMWVFAWRATMLAGDRSQGIVEA